MEWEENNINTSFDSIESCCGIGELYDIHSVKPDVIVEELESHLRSFRDLPLIIFSDTNRKSNCGGNALAKYIVEKKLGTVVKSDIKVNPNTRRKIAMWIWTVDYKKLRKYFTTCKN